MASGSLLFSKHYGLGGPVRLGEGAIDEFEGAVSVR